MEAAHITWRRLGELFVERRLITQDQLEEALVEQRETRGRLGAILVSRGLVSGPELTSVLVDQLGMELTKESGFGSGLWDEIRQPYMRGGRGENGEVAAVEIVSEPEPEMIEAGVSQLAALRAEMVALEAALEKERTARRQTLEELGKVQAEAAARAAELKELAAEVAQLRGQIEASAVERESRAAAEELESARSEAGVEAKELRASVERVRVELEQLDAATAWFELWSGSAATEGP